jgi:colicin import membrane protein
MLYQELLISIFHEQLELPELGEVTLKVTIHKDGSIRNVVVVAAESLKNRTYLQENLPLLHLPKPATGTFSGDEHTFLITFSHAL